MERIKNDLLKKARNLSVQVPIWMMTARFRDAKETDEDRQNREAQGKAVQHAPIMQFKSE